MNGKVYHVFLFFIITGILFACDNTSQTANQKVSPIRKKQLQDAVFFAKSNLSAFGDSGYVSFTPQTAAEKLVETMNAAQVLLPDEEEQFRQAGIHPPKAIPHVLDKPTQAWQVVVIPLDSENKIRISGFGPNLAEPLFVEDVPCCQF